MQGQQQVALDKSRTSFLLRCLHTTILCLLQLSSLAAQSAATQSTEHRKTSTPYAGDLSIFENPERDQKLQIQRVMDILGIHSGTNVADIGAGSGWFTVRAAKRTGNDGTVYAVDINPESIKYIDDRVQKERFHNVKTILSTPDDPKLPPNSVDSVLILKTYHEIAAPVVLLENLRRSLRSSARLGIIDRNGNGQDHGVQKDVVIKEAAQAGYRLVEQYDFVKPDREDYFLVFQLNSDQAQERSLTIVTDYAFDGRGKVLRNLEIEIRGDKIVSIRKSGGNSSRPNYDLRGFTVLPGWIDSHTHPTWHFGPNGHFGEKDELPERATLEAEGNAWRTLLAGFTTIQSLGSPEDVPLRDAINRGVVPGPRILTAVNPLTDEKLTPDQIREFVRKVKADGADVLKIFASSSIRQGGGQTLGNEQLKAACDEARAQGMRSVVHAYKDAVKASADAGCTEVEHGSLTTDDNLRDMASHGTWFDPQVGLVIHNYLDNKEKFLGAPGYTEEGFAKMQEVLPLNVEMFKRALKTPGLKIVFGTAARIPWQPWSQPTPSPRKP